MVCFWHRGRQSGNDLGESTSCVMMKHVATLDETYGSRGYLNRRVKRVPQCSQATSVSKDQLDGGSNATQRRKEAGSAEADRAQRNPGTGSEERIRTPSY